MYMYLLHDNLGNFNGVYIELNHVYMRMFKLWLERYCTNDKLYYKHQHYSDKVTKDWILYKIPVGEFEEVFIQNRHKENVYNIEVPDTYGDLRCAIRNVQIDELTE